MATNHPYNLRARKPHAEQKTTTRTRVAQVGQRSPSITRDARTPPACSTAIIRLGSALVSNFDLAMRNLKEVPNMIDAANGQPASVEFASRTLTQSIEVINAACAGHPFHRLTGSASTQLSDVPGRKRRRSLSHVTPASQCHCETCACLLIDVEPIPTKRRRLNQRSTIDIARAAKDRVSRLLVQENLLKLHRQRNYMAPINLLPDALLRRIFLLVRNPEYIHWIKVSQVCYHWRVTALSDHTLWSRLILSQPAASLEFMRRAHFTPLHLYVPDEWRSRKALAVAKTALLEALEKGVHGSPPRLASVRVDGRTSESDQLCRLVSQHASELLSYDVSWPSVALLQVILPKLKVLKVSAAPSLSWDSELMRSLSNLRVLVIEVDIYKVPISGDLEDVVAVLERNQQLEHLDLCRTLPPWKEVPASQTSESPITLPHLRSLSIFEYDVRSVVFLLRRLQLPQTCRASLQIVGTEGGSVAAIPTADDILHLWRIVFPVGQRYRKMYLTFPESLHKPHPFALELEVTFRRNQFTKHTLISIPHPEGPSIRDRLAQFQEAFAPVKVDILSLSIGFHLDRRFLEWLGAVRKMRHVRTLILPHQRWPRSLATFATFFRNLTKERRYFPNLNTILLQGVDFGDDPSSLSPAQKAKEIEIEVKPFVALLTERAAGNGGALKELRLSSFRKNEVFREEWLDILKAGLPGVDIQFRWYDPACYYLW
ncbi:hypothetical protein PUNSTDRAFT_137290 [Punctularia strigosozonata HHB-11173 SS5]|uniref:uncharacterized protein n=1 Tax=Punctularia strigosozonata (strain HHB-11173) TaxID=741275 RepID=UPI00044179F0|nr:uncharacterized protein PUNSTDRAFT_137290 [Punctularia strigosozonata HHB-11173 SS5]EIN05804.1 hypothetical protein PUNSTDRAFT_137290 [Punctularia strigosozonata HHB-11173 SS5]